MRETGKIDYIEYPCSDLAASTRFFAQAFGWRFVEYGPEYVAFENAGLDGGFYASDRSARVENGSALMVLYAESLESALTAVKAAGGEILQPIFSFPGGRRFHFADPSGNEYAVWSDGAS